MIPDRNPKVVLHVQDRSHDGKGDFINVTASNGEVYSYKYTGGNHGCGQGSVVLYVGGDATTIQVEVVAQNRYSIVAIECRDDLDQLTCEEASGHWTITDACSREINAYYKVIVADRKAKNATIACDPMIVNQPK